MKKRIVFLILCVISLFLTNTAESSTNSYIYTDNNDFVEGTMEGINFNEVPNQLQLNKGAEVFPYIWIANAAEGTLSKLDARTGREVARYRTGPSSSTSPSRTAVDNEGNCWVANRGNGAVLKISMNGGIDKNNDGEIKTSHDANGNGRIDSDEILPWGEDEAVLVNVVPGSSNSAPRGLVLDKKGRVWVGLYRDKKYVVLDKEGNLTGIEVNVNGQPYGTVIDKKGHLWSVSKDAQRIERIDTNEEKYIEQHIIDKNVYGIAVDGQGIVWSPTADTNELVRLNPETGEYSLHTSDGVCGRGVAVDNDGNIWVAFSTNHKIGKFDGQGNHLFSVDISSSGDHPIGVAVDDDGNIWAVNRYSDNAVKIKSDGEIMGFYPVGEGPYTYSDMTGFNYRNFTNHEGKWTITTDSSFKNYKWEKITWLEEKPEGTNITVKARSANIIEELENKSYIELENSQQLAGMTGRYIQVQVLMTTTNIDSPILKEMSIQGLALSEFIPEGNKAIYEGKNLEFTVEAINTSGKTLSYSADNLPEGATFDSQSRVFQWKPDFTQAGEYNDIHFEVTDGTYTDSMDINIRVYDKNQSPEFEKIADKKVIEGEELQFTVNAIDPDGDEMKYSAASLPEGAVFDPVGQEFSWTPEIGQFGKYEDISFYVIDQGTETENLMDVAKIDILVEEADKIPPVTTIHLEGEKWSDGWFKTDIEVTLTAEDNEGGSGIKEIYYYIGEKDQVKTYTGPFKITEEGLTELFVYSVDNRENQETPHMTEIKYAKGWATVDGLLEVNPEVVNNSELAKITYDISNTGYRKIEEGTVNLILFNERLDKYINLISTTHTLKPEDSTTNSYENLDIRDGKYIVILEAEVNGEKKTLDEARLVVDSIPPMTAYRISRKRFIWEDIIYGRTSSELTLSSYDWNIGLEKILCDTGGGYKEYNSPISFEEGIYEIYYKSTDKLGNEENEHKINLYIDETPPLAELDLVEVENIEEITGEFQVNITAEDNIELDYIELYINGTEYSRYNTNLSSKSITEKLELEPGTYELQVKAVDRARYVGWSESINIKIIDPDQIPPVTTVHLDGEKWSDGWFKSEANITLTARDNPGGTGVANIYYRIGTGSYQKYTEPFTVEKDGINSLSVYAVDNNNNEEIPHKTEIKISKPWTVAPYAILAQNIYNYGEFNVDKVFSNGDVVLYGNCEFNYIGTHQDSIVQDGQIKVHDLDLSAPRRKLPIPDWEALEENTTLRHDEELINNQELKDIRYEKDISIYGVTNLSGLLVVDGNLTIHDQIVFDNLAIFCTGTVTITGNIKMDGFIYAGSDLTIYGQPEFTGAMVIDGKALVAGNIQNSKTEIKQYLRWLKRVDLEY